MIKKLGHIAKPADKDKVTTKKVTEQVAEQVNTDSQLKVASDSIKNKYSLFAGDEVQPCLKLPPAAHFEEAKTIDEEKDVVLKDEVQIKQRSPLTILSEDEGYLLEDEQPVDEVGLRVEACEEFLSSECKTAKPKKKKRTAVPYRRPKTRPTNKLRWNMKKLLNPKLNARQEAVVIDSSSSEEAKIDKQGSKSKRKSMVKSSSSSQSKKTKISQ